MGNASLHADIICIFCCLCSLLLISGGGGMLTHGRLRRNALLAKITGAACLYCRGRRRVMTSGSGSTGEGGLGWGFRRGSVREGGNGKEGLGVSELGWEWGSQGGE